MKWIVFILIFLSVVLLFSNVSLMSLVKEVRSATAQTEILSLRHERAQLAAQRARLEGKVGMLQQIMTRLTALEKATAQDQENLRVDGESGEEQFDIDALWRLSAEGELAQRPNPKEIPLLTPEEKERLRALRSTMPRRMNANILLYGDVTSILDDPQWNPDNRILDEDQRIRLARLISDYRYFARLSPMERFHSMVKPELAMLRDHGAFVDYHPEEDGPPAVEGVAISHSEPSDVEGHKRLYYFFPDDYPDLYHHYNVEQERGFETFVEIYQSIQGGQIAEAR